MEKAISLIDFIKDEFVPKPKQIPERIKKDLTLDFRIIYFKIYFKILKFMKKHFLLISLFQVNYFPY